MDNMNSWYEKELSKTNVEQKLSVPSRWAGEGRLLPALAAGSEAVPIRMKGDKGEDYTFMLTVRPAPPARPEFSHKERHAYVVENGLKPGDTVYVWWDTRGFIRLRARVPPQGPFKLFGDSFLY